MAAKTLTLNCTAILAVSLFTVACSEQQSTKPPEAVAKRVYSTFGSMAPSNTEIVYAIGAEKGLVGVCTQCDYPAAARTLPKLGNFQTPDLEKFATTAPQAALLVNGQEAMADSLTRQKAFTTKVEVLNNATIDDIAKNVVRIGELTGRSQQAKDVANNFRQSVEEIRKTVGNTRTRPKVFFCVWPEPLISIGRDSYLNDAITICGGSNISAASPGGYPPYNVEKLLLAQPDVIIMPAEVAKDSLRKQPWTSLQAVKENRVYFLPDRANDRLSRPTVRTIDGLYWLAQCIHPELTEQLSMSKNSIRHLSAISAGNR